MAAFDPELAQKPQVVAMSKADLPDVREAYPGLRAKFKKKKIDLMLMSAAARDGIDEVSYALWHALGEGRRK